MNPNDYVNDKIKGHGVNGMEESDIERNDDDTNSEDDRAGKVHGDYRQGN